MSSYADGVVTFTPAATEDWQAGTTLAISGGVSGGAAQRGLAMQAIRAKLRAEKASLATETRPEGVNGLTEATVDEGDE